MPSARMNCFLARTFWMNEIPNRKNMPSARMNCFQARAYWMSEIPNRQEYAVSKNE